MIGKADIVETVVGVLDEKKKGWEADAEDRKLRNYTETIEVDPIFHSKIIGYKVNNFKSVTLAFSWQPRITNDIFRASVSKNSKGKMPGFNFHLMASLILLQSVVKKPPSKLLRRHFWKKLNHSDFNHSAQQFKQHKNIIVSLLARMAKRFKK